MIRRHFFLVAALAALVLMLVVGGLKLAFGGKAEGPAGAGGPGGRGGRGTAVSQTVAAMKPFANRIEVLGVAKGRQSVTITSNTAEMITAVHFHDGQTVSRGQVLVELKDDQENAGIAQAQAQLNQAQRDYTRWKTLAEKGIAPRATAEQYLSAVETGKAAMASAQAQRLDRVIRAPFAGRVGISDVAPGMLISPGTAIVSLDDVSVIRVDFSVPDRYLPVLREGLTLTASPDSLPGQTFTGHIAQIDTRIDATTRAVKARAEFPNANGQLKPGMLVKVGIDQGQRQAVAVPESAVQFEGQQASVYLIAKGPKGMVARRQVIETGLTVNGQVEVLSGLKPGTKIVADGLNRVQDGAPISAGGGRGKGGPGAEAGPGGHRPGGAGRKPAAG